MYIICSVYSTRSANKNDGKLKPNIGGGNCGSKSEAEAALKNWYGASIPALGTASASDFGQQLPPLIFEGSIRIDSPYIPYIHFF